MDEKIFALNSASVFSDLRSTDELLRRLKSLFPLYKYTNVEISGEVIQVNLNENTLNLHITIFKEGGDKGAKLILGFYNYCKNRIVFIDEQKESSVIKSFGSIKMIVGLNFQSIKNYRDIEPLLKCITGHDDLIFDGAYLLDNSLNILARLK